jgi:LysM repeat protein
MRRFVCLLVVMITFVVAFPVEGQDGSSVVTHVVQPGENLYRIALLYDTSVEAIMQANGLANPDVVVLGQELIIPVPEESTPVPVSVSSNDVIPLPLPPPLSPPDDPNTHTVTEGETLYHIAATHDVTVEALLAVNDIADPALLRVGQVLTIPAPPAPAEPVTAPGAVIASFKDTITFDVSAVRDIYRRGQALGNNPHAFSKIGDCNSELPFFLGKFDEGKYNLGPYADLQTTIDYFAGSFVRDSATVWTGNHAWAVFDSTWANPAMCEIGETPLECEFRVHHPSFVLIRLGTNEAGQTAMFEDYLRRIVEFAIGRGVIPVLGTKADRLEGSNAHNDFVRQLAAEYDVPLWDFDRAASALPNRGLAVDGFHMNWFPLDYGDARGLQYGHPVHNLTALITLDMLRQVVTSP